MKHSYLTQSLIDDALKSKSITSKEANELKEKLNSQPLMPTSIKQSPTSSGYKQSA